MRRGRDKPARLRQLPPAIVLVTFQSRLQQVSTGTSAVWIALHIS
jgi:hypothetical protein